MIISIDSDQDLRLEPFRQQQYTPYLPQQLQQDWSCSSPIFVVESEKVLTALIQEKIPIVALLAEPRYMKKWHSYLKNQQEAPIHYLECSEHIMTQIVGYRLHQGIMAIAKRPPWTPLDDLKFPCLFLNQLANAENVGAIIRSARFLGYSDIIIDAQCSDPFVKRSVRVSMGSLFGSRLYSCDNEDDFIKRLQKNNIPLIGTDLSENALPLPSYSFPEKFCLIMGSEGKGISPSLKKDCDILLKIPGDPTIDSLNVTAACALFLYKARYG